MKQLFIIVALTMLAGCATISEDERLAKVSRAFECDTHGFIWLESHRICVTQGVYMMYFSNI